MSEIIPAIVPISFQDLEEKLSLVSERAVMVHVDVENGTLTKNTTWPYLSKSSEFEKIKNEEAGFPFWENLNFEAHIMAQNPDVLIEDWIRVGAERIIVHVEGFDTEESLLKTLREFRNRFDITNSYVGTEIGLAINLKTPLESVLPYIMESDFVHLMSIREIGEQHHPFENEIYPKIKALKEAYPDTIISVDGGITLPIAEELIQMGVDRLVVGSAIFGDEDPEEALEDFLLLNKN